MDIGLIGLVKVNGLLSAKLLGHLPSIAGSKIGRDVRHLPVLGQPTTLSSGSRRAFRKGRDKCDADNR
jgi:hypothetical protein